jgi:putative chitinase
MLEDLKQKLNLQENYVSMGLGLIVVLVVGAIIFNAVTGRSKVGEVSESGESVKKQEATASAISTGLPTKYTVAKGEDLWSISEKFYGSGFNWVDIVEKNKIKNPDKVEAGTQLTIPAVTPKPTISKGQAQVYTVRKGETLFDISVKVYGDGFKWTRIARANNLRNPNLIEAGQKLTIPR